MTTTATALGFAPMASSARTNTSALGPASRPRAPDRTSSASSRKLAASRSFWPTTHATGSTTIGCTPNEQCRPGGRPRPRPEPAGQQHRERDAEQVKRQRDQMKALGPEPERCALGSIGQDGDRHGIRELARRDQPRDAIGQRIDGQRVAEQVARVIPVREAIAERREVGDRGHHQGEPKRQYGPAPHSLEATGSAAALPAKTRSHRRTRARRIAAHRSAATGW